MIRPMRILTRRGGAIVPPYFKLVDFDPFKISIASNSRQKGMIS